MARASGISRDLRKDQPYEVYQKLNFNVPIGHSGDCFDRYLVRVHEMRESLHLMWQCINMIPAGPVKLTD